MNQSAENIETGDVASGVDQTGALQTEPEIQNAARRNMYALMADVFRHPDQAFRDFVRNGELIEALGDILPNLPFEFAISDQEKSVLRFSDKFSDDDVESEFIRLFDAGMADLVEPGGTIILAGILAEQADGVRTAGESHDLAFVEQRHIGDWVALAMRKP